MTTPIIMLVLLTLPYLTARGFSAYARRDYDARGAAAVGLVLFFPANVYAALHHVPMGGHAWGPVYLLVRAPLQLFILIWAYWFTLRQPEGRLGRGRLGG